MAEPVTLKSAEDGFSFGAYHAAAEDARRGGLVLIQEIFGVTAHIRALADGYAGDGYEVLTPSLYDRRQPGFEAGLDAQGLALARRYSEEAPWDEVAGDLAAAVAALKPPVFVVGYCWGGTATWLAAARCEGVAAASSFYGRRIPELIGEAPRCPIILHFGRNDPTIPPTTVEAIAAAYPEIPIHLYDAGHGFVSDRSDHDDEAARLAHLRTLQLFTRHGGGRGEN
ncbi:MAG: dienelactone hydrolase family protein [Caulobacteraceae bacterium]|nr:dienelactone hydrolase family protein [Caulobacteraceae bacterium]